MAVKTLYVVLNNKNEELMRTEDKKHADWYDKRLDVAENIQELILKVVDEKTVGKLSEKELEEISVSLAMHSNKLQKVIKGKTTEEVVESDGIDSEYKSKAKEK